MELETRLRTNALAHLHERADRCTVNTLNSVATGLGQWQVLYVGIFVSVRLDRLEIAGYAMLDRH